MLNEDTRKLCTSCQSFINDLGLQFWGNQYKTAKPSLIFQEVSALHALQKKYLSWVSITEALNKH